MRSRVLARRQDDVFKPFAVGIERDVCYLEVLTVDLVIVIDRFHLDAALVGVIGHRAAEEALLGSELIDDLLRRDGWLRGIQRAESLVERHGGVGNLAPGGDCESDQGDANNKEPVCDTSMWECGQGTLENRPV